MNKIISTFIAAACMTTVSITCGALETHAQELVSTCSISNFDPAASMCQGFNESSHEGEFSSSEINHILGLEDLPHIDLYWHFDAQIKINNDLDNLIVEGPNSLDFNLTVDPTKRQGSWSFGVTELNDFTPFSIILTTSEYYSVYYFEAGSHINSGMWDISGIAVNGDTPAEVSYASLYVADILVDKTFPEPGTLLGLGVLGGALSFLRRRPSN